MSNANLTHRPTSSSVLSQYGITGVSGHKATKIADAILSAQSSILTRSDYLSAVSVVATQLDGEVFQSIYNNGFPYITSTAPPSWFTGLPSKVQSELYSAESVMGSVYSSATSAAGAARPTAAFVAGIVGAAGVLGLAAV